MLYAVIMAGGSGTRFWPQSRQSRPKQLLKIAGDKTMIRATVERVLDEISFERIMVVTSESYAQEISGELPELSSDMLVCEPQGRNTAPCIALAAYKLLKKDPEAVMAVLPADHVIADEQAFRKALKAAAEVASSGDYLITFGIVPNKPETGYGYIELGERATEQAQAPAFKVKRFVEKPDQQRAEEYIKAGTFLWNSGMFVWKASVIIENFEKHLPGVSEAIARISSAFGTEEEGKAIAEVYNSIEGVSIDYGIMEKAANVLVIPIDVGWNDVGSWASLHEVWANDHDGNIIFGELIALAASGCVVSSPHKLTALIGVEDLVVVDTPDALLVCRKDKAQDVRKLQELLKEKGYTNLL
ncbi:MAG: mannose-1-phosphate guanylyltransferase [Desulfomonile tiedjei]|nr:mannose-1-phosphate guanylyltransferase [Desulfomonile tiedjei]